MIWLRPKQSKLIMKMTLSVLFQGRLRPERFVLAFVSAAAVGLASSPGLAQTFGFTNSTEILITDTGNPPSMGSPYASTLDLTGVDGVVSHVAVTLHGLRHDFPSDLDIALVGPAGQVAMLMSEVGGNTKFPVSGLTLTLDNSATDFLPIDSMLVSGVFKPTRQFQALSFDFPEPAPAGTANAPADLSLFNGTDPNGTWQLFVIDDSSPDSGTIASGWSLDIVTVPEPSAASLLGLGLAGFAFWRCRKQGSGLTGI
jgi:hypothetical protein